MCMLLLELITTSAEKLTEYMNEKKRRNKIKTHTFKMKY